MSERDILESRLHLDQQRQTVSVCQCSFAPFAARRKFQ